MPEGLLTAARVLAGCGAAGIVLAAVLFVTDRIPRLLNEKKRKRTVRAAGETQLMDNKTILMDKEEI